MLKTPKAIKALLTILLLCITPISLTSCDMPTTNDTSETETDTDGLLISNTQGINNQGILTVTGDVTNNSNVNIKKLIITVTFYDDSNNELSQSKDTYENILLPNETYHFKVNCIKKDAKNYDVYVNAFS
jgi:hypothetical protein